MAVEWPEWKRLNGRDDVAVAFSASVDGVVQEVERERDWE